MRLWKLKNKQKLNIVNMKSLQLHVMSSKSHFADLSL